MELNGGDSDSDIEAGCNVESVRSVRLLWSSECLMVEKGIKKK
jgi:hypothetical protein